MTLQQLRDFLAVTEHGSFRAAARFQGVSQAGLTNSLKALETHLGTALLTRSGRGVQVTPAGELLKARARLIHAEAHRATVELRALRDDQQGPIQVGFSPTPSALLLPQVIPHFLALYPRAELRIVDGLFEHLMPAVRQGQLDFAVLSLPHAGLGGDVKAQALMQTAMVVVGRQGHPLAKATRLQALAGQSWILMGPPGAPGGTVIRMFTEAGLAAPHIAVVCDSFIQVTALMFESDYLALLPRMVLERGLLGQHVVAIAVAETARSHDIALVQRAEVPLTPMAGALAAMLLSCARSVGQLAR